MSIRRRQVRSEGEDPWPGEQWLLRNQPTQFVAGGTDVDWGPRNTLIGVLFLPDDSILEVHVEEPSFGFGRWLDELDS